MNDKKEVAAALQLLLANRNGEEIAEYLNAAFEDQLFMLVTDTREVFTALKRVQELSSSLVDVIGPHGQRNVLGAIAHQQALDNIAIMRSHVVKLMTIFGKIK